LFHHDMRRNQPSFCARHKNHTSHDMDIVKNTRPGRWNAGLHVGSMRAVLDLPLRVKDIAPPSNRPRSRTHNHHWAGLSRAIVRTHGPSLFTSSAADSLRAGRWRARCNLQGRPSAGCGAIDSSKPPRSKTHPSRPHLPRSRSPRSRIHRPRRAAESCRRCRG